MQIAPVDCWHSAVNSVHVIWRGWAVKKIIKESHRQSALYAVCRSTMYRGTSVYVQVCLPVSLCICAHVYACVWMDGGTHTHTHSLSARNILCCTFCWKPLQFPHVLLFVCIYINKLINWHNTYVEMTEECLSESILWFLKTSGKKYWCKLEKLFDYHTKVFL